MIPSEHLRAARILIVDDEPANVALLEAVLRREGYEAIEGVTDPHLAVERRLAFEPDLVILDLMMPGIDGYALLDALRRVQPPDDFLPVLVLTADTTVEAKRRALALGARDIVTKPFDVFELGLRIANLLELRFLYRTCRA
ncbi:response regulator [Sphingomonas lenta]|uniref:Two-component system response regulator n=1 Tax=Sphingomonas lenta TaxID=1141887 RepID=A0A2A2SI04_9SPHN|nr:response regulator [Sphingomonas lenta]PAX08848.1 two-component system response regulator [Sphingomonas lenta]